MKKRMLIVYPNNFLQGMQGTNTRVYELVKIFKELDYTIDFLGYENFTPDSSFQNFDELNKDKLIENLYIYDFHKPIENGKNIFIEKIKNKLKIKFVNDILTIFGYYLIRRLFLFLGKL